MPTVARLEPAVAAFIARQQEIPRELIRPDGHLVLSDDLEAFFTYLVTHQPFLREYDELRFRAAFMRIAEWLRDHLAGCQEAALAGNRPPWIDTLVTAWHEAQLDVITLNYDTLVECAVQTLQLPGRKGRVMPEEVLAVPIRFARGRFMGRDHPIGESTFHLHKLHGSLSWFYSGAPGRGQPIVDAGFYGSWGGSQEKLREQLENVPGLTAYIAPPTLAKDPYYDHEAIREVWVRSGVSLGGASRLFILGYSLPPGDSTMRALLQTRLDPRTEVIVADSSRRTLDRYQKFFGDDRVTAFGGKEPIRPLVNKYVR